MPSPVDCQQNEVGWPQKIDRGSELRVDGWPRDCLWKRGAGAAPFGFKGAAFALLWLSELARQSESIPAHPWHKSSNCSMASLEDAVPIFGPRDSGAQPPGQKQPHP
jgi:hypothetical protein